MHWLSHFFGLDNLSGPFYGFWSGVGSDFSEIALIGGAVALYRKHECHQDGCWRLGKHPAAYGVLVLCRKHHPDIQGRKLTASFIAEMHRNYTNNQN